MVEKDKVFEGKVKQSGVFDFKELYSFCYNWLIDQGYLLTEKLYNEKIGASGKDVEIEWLAFKKVSDYFKFSIKVNWRILGMTRVEVEKDGVKTKMDKGIPEIKIAATLEKDYENRWESNPFYKFLRGTYDRYLIRARIDQYEGKLFMETDEFIAQIKAFLAIEGLH